MILNRTTKARDRFRVVKSGMGCAGLPAGHPNIDWCVANGVDRGNGYQGYYAVDYFLKENDWAPPEAKAALVKFLENHGYGPVADRERFQTGGRSVFRVVIEFDGRHDVVGPPYKTKDDAERAIARWRAANGSNGQDTGFSVQEEFGPYPAASAALLSER